MFFVNVSASRSPVVFSFGAVSTMNTLATGVDCCSAAAARSGAIVINLYILGSFLKTEVNDLVQEALARDGSQAVLELLLALERGVFVVLSGLVASVLAGIPPVLVAGGAPCATRAAPGILLAISSSSQAIKRLREPLAVQNV